MRRRGQEIRGTAHRYGANLDDGDYAYERSLEMLSEGAHEPNGLFRAARLDGQRRMTLPTATGPLSKQV